MALPVLQRKTHSGWEKSDNYPLREKMRQFRSVCFGRFDLIRMFLESQIQAAFADGSLHPNERAVLYVIAEELGISRAQFDQFFAHDAGRCTVWRRLSAAIWRW